VFNKVVWQKCYFCTRRCRRIFGGRGGGGGVWGVGGGFGGFSLVTDGFWGGGGGGESVMWPLKRKGGLTGGLQRGY